MPQVVIFAPYLHLHGVFAVGPWRIGPFAEFDDSVWPSPQWRRHAAELLAAYRDGHGRPIEHPSLVVSARSGATFARIPAAFSAVQRAVTFGALVGNRGRVVGTRERNIDYPVTTDNTELQAFQLDPDRRWVAFATGSMMLETLSGGWRIGDADFRLTAPAELSLAGSARISADTLQAAYRVSAGAVDAANPVVAPRVRTAMDWLAQVWRNTPSIRPIDRVVMLKTAFEALTGESRAWEGAVALRALFETLRALPDRVRLTEPKKLKLLWSSRERERFTVAVGTRMHPATPLQDWFVEFSRTRNAIIHDGAWPSLKYRKRRSRFNGHYVWVGEWVLRKSILIAMEQLGLQNFWRSENYRIAANFFAAHRP